MTTKTFNMTVPIRKLYFLMGPTCSGKTSFQAEAKKMYGDAVGLIEIGKQMRAKYPPSHFNGMGAPKHTAAEAWRMFLDSLVDHLNDPRVSTILVEGQPRDEDQAMKVLGLDGPFEKNYVYFYSSEEELRRRLDVRFPEASPARALALQRIKNDKMQYCDVFVVFAANGVPVRVVETTRSVDVAQLLLELGRPYEKETGSDSAASELLHGPGSVGQPDPGQP